MRFIVVIAVLLTPMDAAAQVEGFGGTYGELPSPAIMEHRELDLRLLELAPRAPAVIRWKLAGSVSAGVAYDALQTQIGAWVQPEFVAKKTWPAKYVTSITIDARYV